ncbi:UNVERIFIED_CONTAM: hypothetical protein GTU68_024807 [Idotea baltica]|nr:hypothetical protein [Idotea baltica]
MMLCTVVSNYEQKDVGFLPLTVDYREKFAAAGRYPGGFFKREARPSDGEVLTMRLVDRVLRPLFPKDYTAETQVMIQLMSHDEDVMPDAMAGLAASAAIQLSDFPFECAISEARVGRVNGEFIINPTRAQLAASDIDMMIGASADSVMMVEGEMDEISEEEMADAIKFAHEAIKVQCAAQLKLAEAFGKKPTREYEAAREDKELEKKVHDMAYDKVYAIAEAGSAKHERSDAFKKIKEDIKATFSEEELADYSCPYTVRVVSEVLESNGSSSMATVCAGTMALMDAGVQMIRPVSGIAMGLISDAASGKYAVLSDILGDEDHLGDMDFKVTGTSEGITACQMDIKVKGLSYEILVNALKQAREGRLHILGKITETISTANAEVKDHAPKMINRRIPNDMIGAFIGPGGKHIQELQKETGTTIVITEDAVTEEGIIEILGTDPAGIEQVIAKIESMLFKPEKGSVYEVKVIKMLDFGAVVEYVEAPGNEVLLHVSELAWERTENVTDVVNMGDVFDVKYFGLDTRTRKEKVSRKALLPKPEGFVARPPRDNNRSGGRDNRGSRDNRGRDDRKPRAPREPRKEE